MHLVKRKMLVLTAFMLLVLVIFDLGTVVLIEGSDQYARSIQEIDGLINEEIKRNDIQGLSVGLVNESGLFWSKGYGYEDKKNKGEATVKTLYRIASVTKPFTATAVMILVDRGLVDLDTPVKQYIHEFSIKGIDERASISTQPSSEGISTKSYPIIETLAGLVP
ncbi:serine hydrolase [Candidatus Bipolaricaulota bacterium]|nr:serine hydrolase [Candidatus Bipolaricaulota bacterium]